VITSVVTEVFEINPEILQKIENPDNFMTQLHGIFPEIHEIGYAPFFLKKSRF